MPLWNCGRDESEIGLEKLFKRKVKKRKEIFEFKN